MTAPIVYINRPDKIVPEQELTVDIDTGGEKPVRGVEIARARLMLESLYLADLSEGTLWERVADAG
jgi:uncharacterized protein YuzE